MGNKPCNTTARRGVLLLVVLALLAMFGLIAITYLIVTNQARRTAQTFDRLDQYTDPPELELHQTAMQIIRGVPTSAKPGSSALELHSLLEGIYGNGWSVGTMRHNPSGTPVTLVIAGPPFSTTSPYSTSGQLIYFHALDATGASVGDVAPYIGRVLTMLDGPAAGLSTRIVGGEPGTPGALQIIAFNGVSSSDVVSYLQNDSTRICRFLINGPAFSGMGRSYSSGTGQLDFRVALNPTATTPERGEAALLPNTAFQPTSSDNTTLRTVAGGANVDYTAVDYNSMLPAMTISDPSSSAYGTVITPSLHRQELVRYWVNRLNPSPGNEADLASLTSRFINMPTSGASPWTPLEWKAFKRRLVLRPLLEDHQSFTGSNPKYSGGTNYSSGFNPLWDPYLDGTGGNYAWDVDNDRDGKPDSLWMDLGLPVRTASDGRRYKPLVAILCKDLDGRLNLNAHGCLAQTSASNDIYSAVSLATWNAALRFGVGSDSASQTAPLLRGQGWGTAEISLRPILSTTELANLLYLRYLDQNGSNPGVTGPSGAAVADALVQNKLFNYWNDGATALRSLVPGTFVYNYWDFSQLNAFGSPPSFKTPGAVGLDVRGSPIYAWMGQSSEQVDNPYEFRLQATTGSSSANSVDKPFTAAELARVLCPFDADAGAIPPRLTSAATSLAATHREEVTTESWDVPAVSVALPPALQARLVADSTAMATLSGNASGWNAGWGSWSPAYPPYPPKHFRDVIAIKMYFDNSKNKSVTGNALASSLSKLLPYEMLRGLKMDLNRPFGNGLDDNGNRVVDEPGRVLRKTSGSGFMLDTSNSYAYAGEIRRLVGTAAVGERLPQVGGTLASGSIAYYYNPISVDFEQINNIDVNGDGTVDDADRAMARQLYARQLYLLGLLAIDHRVQTPATPDADEKNRARMVAQWAVNVVDFYDRDSIMTPFEYDIAPFSPKNTAQYGNVTWNVDGVIDTTPLPSGSDDASEYRGLVWGVERPELLITETLAFHDRRTEDLPVDPTTLPPGNGLVNNTPVGSQDLHNDFDQRFRPEGSFFVELFNPASSLEPQTGEFYSAINGGVNLVNKAPDGTPVWRLAIYDSAATDPDDLTNVDPERTVYFCNPLSSPATQVPLARDGSRHFPSTAPNNSGNVNPGCYAVIGSGRASEAAGGPTTTYLGFKPGETPASHTDTRRIVLDSSSNTSPVQIFDDGTTDDLATLRTSSQIKTPVAVVVDQVDASGTATDRRLSVSEPLDEPYPNVDADGNAMTPSGQYTTPYVSPLDHFRQNMTTTRNAVVWAAISKNGTTANFRFVHLQRLANPLLPWDAHSNPYRTVDSSPVDLTAFNGLTTATDPDVTPNPNLSADKFYTRERGQVDTVAEKNNLWTQQPMSGTPSVAQRATVSARIAFNFQAGLSHTLGYLNYSLNADYQANGPRGPIGGDTTYSGSPRGTPFPWLTWNNRPFANALELLLVPTVSAKQLLANATGQDPTQYPFGRLYGLLQSGSPYTTNNGLFPHLMNFFLQDEPADHHGQPAMMHRLLEYVTVRSLFTGTEIQFNPTTFASNGGHLFPPPFHMVSTYREPGRINLNTIYSSNVWTGLLNRQDLGQGGILDDFQLSRQGYGSSVGEIASAIPTRFARPFRSSAGKYLVPQITDTVAPIDPNGVLSKAIGNEVNSTLLRPSSVAATRPLLSFDSAHNASLITEANNPDRNPYFRYQQLMRLGNLTTTRSNVFAVWLTVGYFEAIPKTRPTVPAEALDYDAVYPEGYTWGQELGSDTGEVKRHRAFYIIDRTIPVGFQRGVDLNAENTILLKRVIE